MSYTIRKHFDYLTPLDAAESKEELKQIFTLKYPKACSKLETDCIFFARMVEEARAHKAWETIGLKSEREFFKQKLGKTVEEVEGICKGVKALIASGHQGPVTPEQARQAATQQAKAEKDITQGTRTDIQPVDNINKLKRGGTGSSYLLRRIARSHPDILNRYEAGEFRSVRAAAIEAGIVKVPTTLEKILKLIPKLSPGDLETLRQEIS